MQKLYLSWSGRKIIVLLILAILVRSTPAGAQARWEPIAGGGKATISLDTTQLDSLQTTVHSVWLKWDWRKPEKLGKYGSYKSAIEHVSIDCASKRQKTWQFIYYDQKGDVIYQVDGGDWDNGPIPESYGEQIVKGVCEEFVFHQWLLRARDTTASH